MADKKTEPSTRTLNDDGEASFSASLHVAPDRPDDAERPESIGRYHIKRLLGHGGFGVVYLALDVVLDRLVAIKVPHSKRLLQRENIEHYLKEARAVAALDHPHIVPVYDVGQTDDYPCYIVSKYIEGTNLSTQIKRSRFRHAESARLAATVAETLHYAHKQGLVHRDVKPANLLIAGDGKPYIVDFGLALRDEDFGKGSRYGGTLAYMSPEQARGEGHRVDGRTDIYSLGAVLYELLTGRRTVLGENKQEILAQIATQEPKPPRQIDDSIPKELERVCLKALAKRAADRYTTARDMADDLLAFLESHPGGSSNRGSSSSPDPMPVGAGETESNSHAANSASRLPRVVPKGLRSFDEHDADFFLELLPGPRDRDGLPDSLRFWKTQIEQLDPDKTFPVGLIYGPSGCGKTSLVKAGLLPRLSADVIAVYVEATPSGTESRLSQALVKRCPAAGNQPSLKELLAALRRGECLPVGKKVLIVLDQFEQWLHARNSIDDAELVQALRQCDGGRVQCLLMVRDDFWLAVSRFLRALEVRLLEGHNVALADLFDLDHARKVLAAFGRAFLKLPENASQTTREQNEFLTQAVDGLADDGKIVCVRLALFAEMMKGKPWTPASLKEVGGAKGVGMAFLEETFSSSLASPEHRYHRDAARAVLRKLLPDSGADIRGQMKSYAELLEASGYARRPRDFDGLLAILDGEVRLITPTAPEEYDEQEPRLSRDSATPARHYQLTHDYLVPSLRTWLTRKQAERMRGRAELRLANIAAEWGAKPDNKRLPATWEYVSIRLLTKAACWNSKEKMVMRAAARFHGRRWAMALAATVFLAALSWNLFTGQKNRIVEERRRQAGVLVDAALVAPADAVPYAAGNVEPLLEYALPILRKRFEDNSTEPARRLRSAVLLTRFGEPQSKYLIDNIENADRDECSNVVVALHNSGASVLGSFEDAIKRAESQQNLRLKAKLAITLLHLDEAAAARKMLQFSSDPMERVVLINAIPQWHGSVERLVEGILESDSEAFRSGIILGIGSIPADDLPARELETAARKFAACYRDMPDAATHSAAGWALRRWQRPLPDLDASVDTGRDWQVNSVGMTMVRVPPAGNLRERDRRVPPATGGQGFWISDREISRRAFQAFIDDTACLETEKPAKWEGADLARSPSPEHPVQNVSWVDGVLFCNWLSRCEHRAESYAWDGVAWELVPGAGGYRLPTEAEWEYACRAGTATEFVSGNDEQFLADYAVYLSNQTAACGSKMPNAWGLFDVHGNVYEWCQDWYIPGRERALRSGAFDYSAAKARFSNRQSNSSNYRSYTVGLRVARSVD